MFTKIKFKLLFYFLLVGIVPFGIAMYLEYQNVADTLRNRSFDQLTTVREVKKKKIEEYFAQIRQEISFFAQSSIVINAMKDFKPAFHQIKPEDVPAGATETLKTYYQTQLFDKITRYEEGKLHTDSVLPTNSKTVFLQSQYLIGNKNPFIANPYHEVHGQYHSTIANFLETYGYYDIFLIDDQTGHIVYSVAKEVDFATSLLSDAYSNTNIGRLFRKIRYGGVKSQTIMCDFETYLPSYLAPAAFIAAPIFEGDTKIGTLIFQIPIDRMDAVMTSNKAWREEGLGDTGESYIVGSDYKMRTNSRFIIESPESFVEQLKSFNTDTLTNKLIEFHKTTVLFQTIHTEASSKAIGNKKGTEIIKDYRGIDALSSFAPLQIEDVNWVILAEIDADEAFEPVYAFAKRALLTVLLTSLLIACLSFLIAFSISNPILKLVKGTQEISNGNLEVRVEVSTNDEIGLLAASFNLTALSLKKQREDILEKQHEIEQQMEEIEAQAETLKEANNDIATQNEEMRQNMEEIEAQRDDILQKTAILEQQKEEIQVQAENMRTINEELATRNVALGQQKEEISAQAEQLQQANSKVQSILDELKEKQKLIEKKSFDTLASINYAKRIQDVLLPSREIIAKSLPESFVFFRPKDIVSGDFYWFAEQDDSVFIAVVDCTGHGVPGAFMSVIGHNLLHEIIVSEQTYAPDQILNELHKGVRGILKQDTTQNRDGMEIALCVIDKKKGLLSFAGARSPLYCVRNDEMLVIRGDKSPIGGVQKEEERLFQQHQISLRQEDGSPTSPQMFYLFSDGFQDQFGGRHGEKYMSKRFRNFLHAISYMPIDLQFRKLEEELLQWQGHEEQTDDVLVIGIRF
ncbi:MAG: HAMP domain-containing protein [Cytophagales bacterium]|nr:MAG: HAMP domain-containing protein [Cytophagales bacterium]